MSNFSLEIAKELFDAKEQFPVDFDLAWEWLNYSRKDNAKRAFDKMGFIKTLDYQALLISEEQLYQEVVKEKVYLTVDCFKTWGMMSNTETGKQIRLYFLECEKIAKNPMTMGQMIVAMGQSMILQEEMLAKQKEQELRIAFIVEQQEAFAQKQQLANIEQQKQLLEQEVKFAAFAQETKGEISDLKQAIFSLNSTISAYQSGLVTQTPRNTLVELVQKIGAVVSLKGKEMGEAMADVWVAISLRLRNSNHKFDLESRKSHAHTRYLADRKAWEDAGKPRGQCPKEPTRPDILEANGLLEEAIQACITVAQTV